MKEGVVLGRRNNIFFIEIRKVREIIMGWNRDEVLLEYLY